MRLALLFMVASAVSAAPAAAQDLDLEFVLQVRLATNPAAAVDSVLASLPRASFAPTSITPPYLVLASPVEAAGVTVRLHFVAVSRDTTLVFMSAFIQQAVTGGSFTMGGTGSGSVGGGTVISVKRDSRAGRDAWRRMEELWRVLSN